MKHGLEQNKQWTELFSVIRMIYGRRARKTDDDFLDGEFFFHMCFPALFDGRGSYPADNN